MYHCFVRSSVMLVIDCVTLTPPRTIGRSSRSTLFRTDVHARHRYSPKKIDVRMTTTVVA